MPKAANNGPVQIDSLTVVVRSARERTEQACFQSILEQGVPRDQVSVIHERPFVEAMRKGYQLGVDSGRPWTLCIDADVIMRSGSIAALLRQASRQQETVFELQGLVLDKLTFSLREAGNHLFRTALLPELLSRIPSGDGGLRPESTAMRAMTDAGYQWQKVNYVVGLHDFEQSCFDIFRKCFTHGQKHVHLLPELIPKLRRNLAQDEDFSMALQGIGAGVASRSATQIDVAFQPMVDGFKALGVEEKPPMDLEGNLGKFVEKTLEKWATSPDLQIRILPVTGPEAIRLDGSQTFRGLDRWWALFQRSRKSLGVVGAIANATSTTLRLIAGKLDPRG